MPQKMDGPTPPPFLPSPLDEVDNDRVPLRVVGNPGRMARGIWVLSKSEGGRLFLEIDSDHVAYCHPIKCRVIEGFDLAFPTPTQSKYRCFNSTPTNP